jgi:hypothetical protein
MPIFGVWQGATVDWGISIIKNILLSVFISYCSFRFPNLNCYSSLIPTAHQGILASLPTLNQPKVHLPWWGPSRQEVPWLWWQRSCIPVRPVRRAPDISRFCTWPCSCLMTHSSINILFGKDVDILMYYFRIKIKWMACLAWLQSSALRESIKTSQTAQLRSTQLYIIFGVVVYFFRVPVLQHWNSSKHTWTWSFELFTQNCQWLVKKWFDYFPYSSPVPVILFSPVPTPLATFLFSLGRLPALGASC